MLERKPDLIAFWTPVGGDQAPWRPRGRCRLKLETTDGAVATVTLSPTCPGVTTVDASRFRVCEKAATLAASVAPRSENETFVLRARFERDGASSSRARGHR